MERRAPGAFRRSRDTPLPDTRSRTRNPGTPACFRCRYHRLRLGEPPLNADLHRRERHLPARRDTPAPVRRAATARTSSALRLARWMGRSA